MPSSPANSLFASDYSLSAPASPVSPRASPLISTSSSGSASASASASAAASGARGLAPPSPLRQKPLDVTFPASNDTLAVSTALPTPPVSPIGSGSPDDIDEERDLFSPESLANRTPRKKSSVAFSEDSSQTHQSRRVSEVSKASRRSSKNAMESYEGCMEGESGRSSVTAS